MLAHTLFTACLLRVTLGVERAAALVDGRDTEEETVRAVPGRDTGAISPPRIVAMKP